MPERKTIAAYLAELQQQIRWKRARPVVTAELERHLEDQRDAFLEDGISPEEAERLAVEEMGDPVSVGLELDRIHRPKPQWGLLTLTMLLAAAGVVLRIWLTAGQGYMSADPARTLLAFAVGCGCLVAAYLLDYTFLLRYARWFYVGMLALCMISLKVSPVINGVSYYTRILTVLLPVAYAVWVYSCHGKGRTGFLYAVMGGMPLALICVLAPSIPGLFFLLCTGLALLLYAIWSGWLGEKGKIAMTAMTALIVLMAAAMFVSAVMEGYFDRRLVALLHPEQDPLGGGYQALMLRKTLEHARWWGAGIWPATEPYPFERSVPNWEIDCLLTTMIFRLGWIPFLLLMLAFAALMGWLLYRCLRQKSRGGKMLALSVILPMGLQAVFSVVLNLGFVLFSAQMPLMVGNVQTVLNLALIGLVLSVFRGDSIARETAPKQVPPRERRRLRIHVSYEWV